MRASWLATAIRGRWNNVNEDPGWQSRGGELTAINGIIFHHTASNPGSDPAGDINYIWHSSGNSLVPEYNVYISRSGAVYVGASGKTNNAGEGGNNGNAKTCGRVPVNWCPGNGANGYGLSAVVANNGVGEQYPVAQQNAAVAVIAAICDVGKVAIPNCHSHFEWTQRKIDPAGNSRYATGGAMWDMAKFRADVQAAIGGGTPSPEPEEDDMAPWLITDDAGVVWYVASDYSTRIRLADPGVVDRLAAAGAKRDDASRVQLPRIPDVTVS